MKATLTLLRELGIQGTYKGYHYVSGVLEIALRDQKHVSLYSKTLFPAVARKYDTNTSCMERDIRTVIGHCWNSSGREKLQEIATYTLDKQPSVSDFLDILYWYLSFMQE